MAPHAEMMIHNGFAMAIGNAEDMREAADLLDEAVRQHRRDLRRAAGQARGLLAGEDARRDVVHRRAGGRRGPGRPDPRQRAADGEARPGAWDLSVYAGGPQARGQAAGRAGQPTTATQPLDPDGDGDDDTHGRGRHRPRLLAAGRLAGPEGEAGQEARTRAWPGTWRPCPSAPRRPTSTTRAWDGPAAMSAASKPMTRTPRSAPSARAAARDPPDDEQSWALPYRKTPDSPPNAAGVRNALARLPQTHGLTNAEEARAKLERLMHEISPGQQDRRPHRPGAAHAAFGIGLEGADSDDQDQGPVRARGPAGGPHRPRELKEYFTQEAVDERRHEGVPRRLRRRLGEAQPGHCRRHADAGPVACCST